MKASETYQNKAEELMQSGDLAAPVYAMLAILEELREIRSELEAIREEKVSNT